MDTSAHIDYLSVTYPVEFNPEALYGYVGKWDVVGAGPHGYQTMLRSELGATCLLHGPVNQGVHVVLKGQPLALMRDDNVNDAELMWFMSQHAGKPSRIDVCVNMFEASTTVTDLWELWRQKKVKTRSRMAKRFECLPDEGTDDGFYVGSKDSDKFMRIYNKGRQVADKDAWVRLELVCLKMNARAISHDLARKDVSTRVTINRAILNHAEFENGEYLEALADNDTTLRKVPRELPNFWAWMKTQVVPAIVSRMADHPEENVMGQLRAMIATEQAKR